MPKAMKKGASRQHKDRFNKDELTMLTETLAENADVVFAQSLKREAFIRKKEIWALVAEKANAVGNTPRTTKDCRKRWDDLRLQVRNILSANRSQAIATGGGIPAEVEQQEELTALVRQFVNDNAQARQEWRENTASLGKIIAESTTRLCEEVSALQQVLSRIVDAMEAERPATEMEQAATPSSSSSTQTSPLRRSARTLRHPEMQPPGTSTDSDSAQQPTARGTARGQHTRQSQDTTASTSGRQASGMVTVHDDTDTTIPAAPAVQHVLTPNTPAPPSIAPTSACGPNSVNDTASIESAPGEQGADKPKNANDGCNTTPEQLATFSSTGLHSPLRSPTPSIQEHSARLQCIEEYPGQSDTTCSATAPGGKAATGGGPSPMVEHCHLCTPPPMCVWAVYHNKPGDIMAALAGQQHYV
ncbi:myb-related transcription factor, partner of profilin-like [Ambystoma mexicanum]|uniref:myb-related transcription factor, partner of profilin-like n=1 Tax=Ambystoma mexicanum TaxID=8296 RepID=UPI0037E900AD